MGWEGGTGFGWSGFVGRAGGLRTRAVATLPSRSGADRPSRPTQSPLQITHPLDTLRLRMAVDPRARTLALAGAALAAEGGLAAFYRGLGASLLGG